ncbi:MAG TPA: hypothetical protein VFB34_00600 [Chloroflexota bacterium]|nr:hypothetical protein [Chloroflexota bacterium]
MNSEERNIILQMLSEGKISPSEAGDLLDALETEEEPAFDAGSLPRPPSPPRPRLDPDLMGRGLLLNVREGDENRTQLHIPLGLALAGGKFIPRKAQEAMEKYGLNLAEILDSIARGEQKGEIVNVQDGDTRVHIAIT